MATQHAGIKRLRSPLQGWIVDGFHFIAADVRHYCLTHAHSDHTCGLYASFDAGIIYCSKVTARVIRGTIGVHAKVIHELDLHESIEVEGVRLTTVDAGHCPGAVMFLFEHLATGHVALHTGDCRASAGVRRALLDELRTERAWRKGLRRMLTRAGEPAGHETREMTETRVKRESSEDGRGGEGGTGRQEIGRGKGVE
mmetsp:Transcript_16333/g.35045  ORF Transcript_16333/g.35045 Transcript_16333/m.35045 type:complete len:198 (+) Transcript_16333:230-823(+)